MAECNWENAESVDGFEGKITKEEYENYLSSQKLASELKTMKSDEGLSDSFWKYFRFDRFAATSKSENPIIRAAGKLIFEDPVGTAGVRQTTASLIKSLQSGRLRTLYYRKYVPHFEDFIKERGLSKNHLFSESTRMEFNELIAKHIRRGEGDSPAVKAVAEQQTQLYKDILNMAKSSGVKGAEEVEENLRYITRMWDEFKMGETIDRIGKERTVNFIARAMRSATGERNPFKNPDGTPDATEKYFQKLSKHLVNSIQRGKEVNHSGINLEKILAGRAEQVKEYLQDIGYNTDDIDEMMSILFSTSKKDGKVKYLRRRVTLDETYFDAQENMSIDELFDNDSERLFLNYVNSMTGQIGLAAKGITSKSDWNKVIADATAWNNEKYPKQISQIKNWVVKNQLDALQSGYDHLVGKPLEALGASATAGRLLRKYNFSRVMNQVGFAQLAEVGVLLAAVGLKETFRAMPELKRMMNRMKDGEIEDTLINELETAVGGVGAERLLNQVTNQTDDFGSQLGATSVGKIERGLDQLNRITTDVSGMNAVNMSLKRIALRGMVQKFANAAMGKGSVMSIKRLEDLGISSEMMERINKQIKTHAEYKKGDIGGTIYKLNLDKWTDANGDVSQEALTFTHSLHRWSRRTIQENDIGETAWLFGSYDTTLGKMIYQFRGFMMTAYGKHLLHGIRMHDWQTFQSFMGSMFFATLAYMGQTYAQSLLLDESEKEEFFEKRFGTGTGDDWDMYSKLGRVGFQRAAFASVIPAVWDSGLELTGFDAWFNERSSGLSSNLLTGNPTAQLFTTAQNAFTGTIKSLHDEDYDYSQTQYNNTLKIMTFQNVLGLQNVLKKFGEEYLPEKP